MEDKVIDYWFILITKVTDLERITKVTENEMALQVFQKDSLGMPDILYAHISLIWYDIFKF